MKICFVPGDPLTMCDDIGNPISGLSVNFVKRRLADLYDNATKTCIHSAFSEEAGTCDVIAGRVGNIDLSSFMGKFRNEFTAGAPYVATDVLGIFSYEEKTYSGLGFLLPFTWDTWLAIVGVFIFALVCASMVPGKFKYGVVRDASTSIIGSSRLYSDWKSSFHQHALSVLMAIFSVFLVALYSSNLIAFTYNEGNFDMDSILDKPLVVESEIAAWNARMILGGHGEVESTTVFDASGSMNEGVMDSVVSGDYSLAIGGIFLGSICSYGGYALRSFKSISQSLIYLPLISTKLDGLVVDMLTERRRESIPLLGAPPSCVLIDSSPPSGANFREIWVLFVAFFASAGLLVVVKLICMFSKRNERHLSREPTPSSDFSSQV